MTEKSRHVGSDRVIRLTLGLAVILGVSRAHADVTVQLAASRSYDTLALSRAHGMIEQRLAAKGIKVVWQGPYTAMAPQIEAMAAGALDFGGGSCTAFATARAADAPILAIGFSPETTGSEGILVPKESPIQSAADLVGKKVAVNKAGTGEYLLLKTLEFYHVPASAVTRVFMGPADGASAFGLGLVDAWAVWEPYVSTAEDKFGARMLIPSTSVGSDNHTVLVARQAFVQDHPDVAREVFAALQEDDAWAASNYEAAAATWARYANQPMSLAQLLASHSGKKMVPVGQAEVAALERAAQWMFDHKLIPVMPTIADHVANLGGDR
jgi:sulfonate transport system substrate-binding protein